MDGLSVSVFKFDVAIVHRRKREQDARNVVPPPSATCRRARPIQLLCVHYKLSVGVFGKRWY